MKQNNRTAARFILTIVFGFFSLPEIIFGLYLLICWLRVHTTDDYYVEYPYMATASIFLFAGALSLLITVWGAWRKSFYGLLFALPVIVGLATMVYIPDGFPHVREACSQILSTSEM